MTTRHMTFQPESGFSALLDHIYHVKFSKHVPLVMILLFAVFAVWRTNHYVSTQMRMGGLISWPLAVCIELAMLASGAACFISMRAAYIRELKDEDVARARVGTYVGYAMFGTTTIALLVLAGADGAAESAGDIAFTLLMLLIQFVQSCAMLVFLNIADLEEREKLRVQYADYTRGVKQSLATRCPYCEREVTPNNRKRHMETCAARLQE